MAGIYLGTIKFKIKLVPIEIIWANIDIKTLLTQYRKI